MRKNCRAHHKNCFAILQHNKTQQFLFHASRSCVRSVGDRKLRFDVTGRLESECWNKMRLFLAMLMCAGFSQMAFLRLGTWLHQSVHEFSVVIGTTVMSLFSLFQIPMNNFDWMFSMSMILFTVLNAFEFFCMIVNAPVISKGVHPCSVTQALTYLSCLVFANLLGQRFGGI